MVSGDSGGADGLGLPAFIVEQTVSRRGLEVYPDAWTAVVVFCDLLTQWRMGFGGPIGLDYQAIPVVLRLRLVPESDWPEIFIDLQILEDAALAALAEQRKNEAR